jgi:hypothetical protein
MEKTFYYTICRPKTDDDEEKGPFYFTPPESYLKDKNFIELTVKYASSLYYWGEGGATEGWAGRLVSVYLDEILLASKYVYILGIDYENKPIFDVMP